jgi:hypothetical protein
MGFRFKFCKQKTFKLDPNTKLTLTNPKKAGYVRYGKAVSWLRRLVAGFTSRRPGFDPRSVQVGFVVDKVALGQVFPPEYFGFTLSSSFHRCSIILKNEKKKN